MNKVKPLWLLFVFVCLCLSSAHGELASSNTVASLSDKVDTLVQDMMANEGIPGLALAVVKDGEILKMQTYGYADLVSKTPVTTNTVFRIGSISKQFIAAAIMMLVEDGKIGLDDPVSKYLNGTPKSWEKITIRNLLTHTSGIPDITNENIPLYPGATNFDQGVFQAVARRRLHFTPGDEWRYSNSNYHLLGMIICKVSGKNYDDFLRERIFKPLGMFQTTVSSTSRGNGTYPGLATGYDWRNALHLVDAPIEVTAGGGVASSIPDMLKWNAALYTTNLLKKSSLQQMWTPVRLNGGMTWPYGFGWDVGRINDRLIVAHGGNFAGFSSEIYRAVDDRLTVIILDNRLSSLTETLAQKIARLYVWKGPDYQPIPDREPGITVRVRQIKGRCDGGKLRAADFTPEVWAELSPWRKQMQEDGKKVGPVLSVVLVEHATEANRGSYRYRIQYKFGTILLHVVFDEQNKIAIWKVEDVDLK